MSCPPIQREVFSRPHRPLTTNAEHSQHSYYTIPVSTWHPRTSCRECGEVLVAMIEPHTAVSRKIIAGGLEQGIKLVRLRKETTIAINTIGLTNSKCA
jgi:hypothetical protein